MADHNIKITISADGSQAKTALQATSKEIDSLNKKKVSGVSTSGLNKSLDQTKNKAQEAAKSMDVFGSAVSKIKGVVAGAFAVGSIVSFGKATLQASANAELLKKGLAFSLGNAGAEQLIANMQAIGEASAYDTSQLTPMARAWVNIGENADQATAKMQTIVDAGSAYGMTVDQLDRVNLALTQMQMKGKISAEEMMQLTEAGLPAWNLLSEQMGVPVAQLQDMASKGQLTQEAMDALFDGMKAKTEGAATSLADSLMGKFSNMEEALTNSMSDIGDIISKAFDIPGVLDQLGTLAESFKAHMGNIKNAVIAGGGVGQAFANELEKISPIAGAVANTVIAAFEKIKSIIESNEGAIKNFVVVVGSIAATVALWNGVAAAIASIRTALIAAKTAALAFRAACAANPVLLAISLIIAALALLYTHWDEVKAAALSCWESASSAASNAASQISGVVGGAIERVRGLWDGLVSAFSHPIDFVVNVTRNVTEKVFGGSSATPEAKGGINGGPMRFASGGLVGGKIPALANGGQLRHGTPAIVGEAGPEAVIPLRKDVLAKIGDGIYKAAAQGKADKNQVSEIQMKIQSYLKTNDVSAYAKVLEEAEEKARAVGEQLRSFEDYEKRAKEEAAKYAADGQETLDVQNKIASQTARIAELQEKINSGKASERDSLQISRLQQDTAEIQAKYDKEKAEAIKAAQEAADARAGIEKQYAGAVEQIRMNAVEKIASRETALDQARAQQKKADLATNLADYQAMMAQRDEITGQSYATELANEEALNSQRQVWHEQMMMNAVEWGTYMQTLLTNLAANLSEGMASGLADCIVKGENLAATFGKLAQNLLTNLVKGVLEKWISSLGIVQALSNKTSKQEIVNAHTQAAAQAAKSGVMAANAAAALIAANPFLAFGAGAIVTGQMAAASVAGRAFSLAGFSNGGAVSGPGTRRSDSIPAMLSNGEYVINADAVSKIGRPALNMINDGYLPFAEGGSVGGKSSAGGSGPVSSPSVTLQVSTMDASSFTDFLRDGGLDTIKQALFDSNRNFAADAGVW